MWQRFPFGICPSISSRTKSPPVLAIGIANPMGLRGPVSKICCSSPSARNSKVDIDYYVVSTSFFTNDLGSDLY